MSVAVHLLWIVQVFAEVDLKSITVESAAEEVSPQELVTVTEML